jgi:hypothetical protein
MLGISTWLAVPAAGTQHCISVSCTVHDYYLANEPQAPQLLVVLARMVCWYPAVLHCMHSFAARQSQREGGVTLLLLFACMLRCQCSYFVDGMHDM